jgi:hypothetical protein
MRKSVLSFGAATVLCLGATGAAQANITFDFSNSGTGNNVNFANGVTANAGVPLIGTTQQTSTNVAFIGNETLATQASGAARITGATDQNLNFIDISLQQANTGFTALVFNLNGIQGQNGTATIIATDQFGNTFPGTIQSLGNGQNFVTVLASNGELIKDVTVSTTTNFGDLEQVRLGGAQALAVPGPIAAAGIPGLVAACGALVAFARRRRKALA